MKKLRVLEAARSLGALSKKWLSPSYKFRQKAVDRLVRHSGYSQRMAEALIHSLFSELTAPKLMRLLRAEIGDPLALDGFRYDKLTDKWQHAKGPRTILHIFSANVPNPAIISFILGMLVKSKNIGKASSRDAGFLDIYLDSLKTHDKKLAGMNELIAPSNRTAAQHWLRRAGLVVAYGSDETIDELKTRVPASTPLIGYGHCFSLSVYTKEALRTGNLAFLAKKTAFDIWMMDQRGCLSPVALYLEKGSTRSMETFMRALEKELGKLTQDLPDSPERDLKKFRLNEIGKLIRTGKSGDRWVSGGGQAVRITTFKNISELEKKLKPFREHLQAIALETSSSRRHELASLFAGLGASRICRAGHMQRPPITWHHDGRPNLADWLRWTDLER